MSTKASLSPVLPVARLALRIAIVLNWLMAAAILVLLFAVPTNAWIMRSLELSPGADAERVILGLRSIAWLGLVTVPLNYIGLKRLLEIVDTVRTGDPFVASNAKRLHTVASVMLTLQLLSIVIGAIGRALSSIAPAVYIDAGFSVNGWLAVLLTFLLARVFAEGARMREDLEGTV